MRPTLTNYLMGVQCAHRLDSTKQERSKEKKAQLAALEEEERQLKEKRHLLSGKTP